MGNKEEGKMPESAKKEADMSSMPVLEEEGPCKELMEKTEESETTPEMQEPLSLDRDTESPPEARHRLPLVVAPREPSSSLRRPFHPGLSSPRVRSFQLLWFEKSIM